MLYTSSLFRWLQRKRYQYEVTFSLYMLTPTEKLIFNSFLVLFLSMIIIAGSLYLPEHVSTIMRRAWFYWAGDEAVATGTKSVLSSTSVARSIARDAGYGGASRTEDVLERLGSL
ncbi:hypothetical protein MMC34_005386 [Xylographa carneopallida]|nr:hypothetical protein [Xylographa carneopallida]